MDISLRTMLVYSAGSIGAGAFYAFNNFLLPLALKAAGAPDLLTGLLSSTRSIEGVVIQPTVGAASDRIWTRLGRRRPFIAICIPLSAVFFLVASAATESLVPLAVSIFLFSIFFNAAIDPYAALLADITPIHQRGLLSGLSQGIQLIGQVGFLGLIVVATKGEAAPPWAYWGVAVAMVATFAVTVGGIHERRDVAARAEHVALRTYLGVALSHGQALRFLATLFVFFFGFSAILPYLTLFLTTDIHLTDQVALALAALALLVTAVTAIAWGKVADRTIVVVVLAGVGNGAQTAVSWPLLTTLIDPDESGIFAGLKAAAESVAIPLSVFVAAEVFLNPRALNLGYRGIFFMLAINMVIALILLTVFVHPPVSETEPAPP
ncbi:MAG: SLC45 family MFS transporter [Chloroflexi bacterium]|nr:MAG: SLC45 family MFS transporter [Chloroflexota bacterium]